MSNGGRCYRVEGGGGDGKWQEMTPIKYTCRTWLCAVLRLCIESLVVSSRSQFLPVTPGERTLSAMRLLLKRLEAPQIEVSNFALSSWGPVAVCVADPGTQPHAHCLSEQRSREKREQSSVSLTPGTTGMCETPVAH